LNASSSSLGDLAVNTIRTLSMDGVQAANSGHPGTPMALAPVTYQIWAHNLKYDPSNPNWHNRDRFVLSCGHASMLLYSMIHLAGIRHVDKHGKVTDRESLGIEDLKKFRQLHSPCAGHPEFGYATGIETTTGPLGQGVGNSVGMAIASKFLGAKYNRPGFALFDYDVYTLCSDGDLMEGISSEAASIAGHLKLSNLCWIYDDNGITIEGHTDLAFSENMAMKFQGLGWHTIHVKDANDRDALQAAFDEFKATEDRPTLIVVNSIIGYGSPNKANSTAPPSAPMRPSSPASSSSGATAPSKCPRRPTTTGVRRSAAARRPKGSGTKPWRPTAVPIPLKPPSSSACSAASCPRAGMPICPPTAQPTRARPPVSTPMTRSTPSARSCLS